MKHEQRNADLKSQHITPADGNVFADLGFAPKRARELLQAADARIAESKRLKEAAAQHIAQWIKAEKLTQLAASQILVVSRPRVSDLVNAKLARFSLDMLISMLLRVGKSVDLVIDNHIMTAPRTKQSTTRRAIA
ncbi:MAG: XRE family transcriptional regulator [Steroidobacteraceae bacterium]